LVKIVTKDSYIVHKVSIIEGSFGIIDAERVDTVCLVQNVVKTQLNSSGAAAHHFPIPLLMGKEDYCYTAL